MSPTPSPQPWLMHSAPSARTERCCMRVWLLTRNWVLHLARGKRCFDLPGLGSSSGTRWWATCRRLCCMAKWAGLRGVGRVSRPCTQASSEVIYLPFSEGWGHLCEHRQSGRLVPAVAARPKPGGDNSWGWQDAVSTGAARGSPAAALHLGLGPGTPGIRKAARRVCETLSDAPWQ